MSYMFAGCSKLKSVDLTYMNLQKVEDMDNMFYYCLALKTIYLKGLNTSNVKNMKSMFELCRSLEHLDLSSFNTQNVKNFQKMFFECSSLKAIYASPKFVVNIPNPISKAEMFSGCSKLVGESMSYSPACVDGDYAKIVGGYFLDAKYLKPWVKQNGKTITLYYGYKKTPGKGEYELIEWTKKIKTKVNHSQRQHLTSPSLCTSLIRANIGLKNTLNLRK